MKKEVKTTMANKAHEEIPGNPSVSTSSNQKLNDRSNGKPLRVLSEEDWRFWMHNGYIVIKNAIPKDQAKATADFIWEFDERSKRHFDLVCETSCRNENERIGRNRNG